MRRLILYLSVVLPGLCAVAVCGYYLFHDWAALISAFARLEQATAGGNLRRIVTAQGLDSIYRINCFADGVGVMLGAVIFSIGVHGLCLLPRAADAPGAVSAGEGRKIVPLAAVGATVLALALFASLIGRVGHSNGLRRSIVRGDLPGVDAELRAGADPNDALWWGSTPLLLARKQSPPSAREAVVRRLRDAGARH